MTFTRAWLNTIEHMPRAQVIAGALAGSFFASGILYVGIGRTAGKPPKTLSPEWRAMSAEYMKHNNADPIYQHPKY